MLVSPKHVENLGELQVKLEYSIQNWRKKLILELILAFCYGTFQVTLTPIPTVFNTF